MKLPFQIAFLLVLYVFNLAAVFEPGGYWDFSAAPFLTLGSLIYYTILFTALPLTIFIRSTNRRAFPIPVIFLILGVLAIPVGLFVGLFGSSTQTLVYDIKALNLFMLTMAVFGAAKQRDQIFSMFWGGLIVVSCISTWSLASPIGMHLHAGKISDGVPYCIGVGVRNGGYQQNHEFWDLIGLRLVSPNSIGGSSDFQFSFHAVLLIENDDRIWNWSKTHFRFEEVYQPVDFPQLQRYASHGCL